MNGHLLRLSIVSQVTANLLKIIQSWNVLSEKLILLNLAYVEHSVAITIIILDSFKSTQN